MLSTESLNNLISTLVCIYVSENLSYSTIKLQHIRDMEETTEMT